MDETEVKHVVEAALLAAGRPLTLDRLTELFAAKSSEVDRATVKRALEALGNDYQGRGLEIKEVASGYRVQVRRTMTDWLQPLWEERAPRYTRALLETLALITYRQPITRGEIEEVRGVVVSANIVRTLLERGWVRVVGHRDVPGRPAMFGTTREFLDYFGLKRLEDLPTLAEIKDGLPEVSPQTDLIDSLEEQARLMESGPGAVAADMPEVGGSEAEGERVSAETAAAAEPDGAADPARFGPGEDGDVSAETSATSELAEDEPAASTESTLADSGDASHGGVGLETDTIGASAAPTANRADESDDAAADRAGDADAADRAAGESNAGAAAESDAGDADLPPHDDSNGADVVHLHIVRRTDTVE